MISPTGRLHRRLAKPSFAGIPRCRRSFGALHLKADNLFFEGTPERVAVDWQHTCRAVGTLDLALLLAQSTSAEMRRAHQWAALRSWYERVLTQVSTPYSYGDAVADYRRSVLFYLVHPVLGGALHQAEDARDRRFQATIAERAFCAATDLDLHELL